MNTVLDAYRQQFDDPRSDVEITLDLGNKHPELLQKAPDFARDFTSLSKDLRRATRPPISQEIPRTIAYGIDQAQAKLYDTAALAGDVIGSDRLKQFGEEGYKRNIEEAEPNAPTVPTYEDIESGSDISRYALGLVGSQLPQIALTGGAAALGALVGGPAGAAIGARAGLAGDALAAARLAAQIRGGAVAAGAAGFTQMQNRAELEAQGAKDVSLTASTVGALGAVLESIIPLKVTSRLFKGASDQAASKYITRVLHELPKNAFGEMSTEVGQEIVSIAGELYANRDNKDFDIPREQIISRLVNNGLAGGLLGGGSAAIESIPGPKAKETSKPAAPKLDPLIENRYAPNIPEATKKDLVEIKQRAVDGELTASDRAVLRPGGMSTEEKTYFTLLGEPEPTAKVETPADAVVKPVEPNPDADLLELADQLEADLLARKQAKTSSPGVPAFLSRQLEQQLSDLGYTREQRNSITPADAVRIVEQGVSIKQPSSPQPIPAAGPTDPQGIQPEAPEAETSSPQPIPAAGPTDPQGIQPEAPVVAGAIPSVKPVAVAASELKRPDNARIAMEIMRQKESEDYQLQEAAKRLVDRHNIKKAEEATNKKPTEKQKENNTYVKGSVEIDGFKILVENPIGSLRNGKDPTGKSWSVKMPATYGKIEGVNVNGKVVHATGRDKDLLDIYVGPNTASEKVWIVDQQNPKTKEFDEHKILFGFSSKEQAIATYLDGFADGSGPGRISAITEMTKAELKTWIEKDDTHKPLALMKKLSAISVDNLLESINFERPIINRKLVFTKAGNKTVQSIANAFFIIKDPTWNQELQANILSQSASLDANSKNTITHRMTFFEDQNSGSIIGLPTYDTGSGLKRKVRVAPMLGKKHGSIINKFMESGRYVPIASMLTKREMYALNPDDVVTFQNAQDFNDKLEKPALMVIEQKRNEYESNRDAMMEHSQNGYLDADGDWVETASKVPDSPIESSIEREGEVFNYLITSLPKKNGKIQVGLTEQEIKKHVNKQLALNENKDENRSALLDVLSDLQKSPDFLELSNEKMLIATTQEIHKKAYAIYQAQYVKKGNESGPTNDESKAVQPSSGSTETNLRGALPGEQRSENQSGNQIVAEPTTENQSESNPTSIDRQAEDTRSGNASFRKLGTVSPGSSAQSSTAHLIRTFGEAVSNIAAAGFNVQVFQQQAAALAEFYRREGGAFSNAGNMIAVVMGDVVNPTIEGIRSLMHEAAHGLFEKETPSVRQAIERAVNLLTDEQLGIAGSADARIRASNPASLGNIAEERLAEHIAQTVDLTKARGIASALWRLVKDLYLRAALAVQKSFSMSGNTSDSTTLAWFENSLERVARGENRYSMIDWLGGRKFGDADVSRFLPKINGDTGIEARWDPDAGRMVFREVLPINPEAARFNLQQRFRNAPPQSQTDQDYFEAVKRGDTATQQRLVDEAAKKAGYVIGSMYHGSKTAFNTFDKSKIGTGTDSGFLGFGFYFTPTLRVAKSYSRKDGNVVSAALKIYNPANSLDVTKVKDIVLGYKPNHYDLPTQSQSEAITKLLQERGFDGIVTDVESVVFDPSQIKSAEAIVRDDQGNVIPLSQRFNDQSNDIRYRKLDSVSSARKANVDQGSEIVLPDVAANNAVDTGLRELLSSWVSMGGNRTTTGQPVYQSFQEFTKWLLPKSFKSPSATIGSIQQDLSRLVKPQIDPATQISNLSESTRRDVANRAITMWNRLTAAWSERSMQADHDLSGKPGSVQSKFDKNARRLSNLVSDYTNADAIFTRAKEAFTDGLNELKQDIRDIKSESRKAGVLWQTLRDLDESMSDPDVPRQYELAINDLLKRLSESDRTRTRLFDVLQSVAGLGIDFRSLTPSEVRETIRIAAQADATLQPLAEVGASGSPTRESNALLSMAIDFAKRDGLAMESLSLRAMAVGTDKQNVDLLLQIAMRDSREAINDARKQAGIIGRVGQRMGRIINTIERVKSEQQKLKAQLDNSKQFYDFYKNNTGVIDAQKAKLEKELGALKSEFEATDYAKYVVPPGPNSPAGFPDNKDNHRTYRTTRDGTATVEMRKHMKAMQDWLSANGLGTPLFESSTYNQVAQTLSVLRDNDMNAEHAKAQSGTLVRVMGSMVNMLNATGHPAAMAASRKLLKLVDYQHRFKGQAELISYAWSTAEAKAMNALGIKDPVQFNQMIFQAGLKYAESRKDIQFGRPNQDSAIAALMPELKLFFMGDPRIASKIGQAAVWKEVEAFFIEHQNYLKKLNAISDSMGNRVNDDVSGLLRRVVGAPLFESPRIVLGEALVMFQRMRGFWGDFDFDGLKAEMAADPNAATDSLRSLFTPEIWRDFVGPIANRAGRSSFYAPMDANGLHDFASVTNVQAAYKSSGGDIVRFAEELAKLSGGTTDQASFLLETVDTLHSFYKALHAMEKDRSHSSKNNITAMHHLLMDARRSEEFPAEFLEYRRGDLMSTRGAVQHMAYHASLGRDGVAVFKDYDTAIAELRTDAAEYDIIAEAAKLASAGKSGKTFSRALQAEATARGTDLKRVTKANQDLIQVKLSKQYLEDYIRSRSGVATMPRSIANLVGSMVSMVVQGPATAMTDTITLFKPIMEYGLSGTSLKMVKSNIATFAAGGTGSLGQVFGKVIKWKADHFRLLQEIGHMDTDNELTLKQKLGAVLHSHPRELKAGTVKQAFSDLGRGADIASGFVRTGLNTGFSRIKGPFITAKPHAVFTWGSQLLNAATINGLWETYSDMVARAALHFQNNPTDAANPAFRFTGKMLHYTKKFGGMIDDEFTFNAMSAKLEENSMSLEQMARDFKPGGPVISHEHLKRIAQMAQNDITMEASLATRSGKIFSNSWLNTATPLVGWAIQQSVNMARGFKGPKWEADRTSFKKGAIAMGAMMSFGMAYALLRDLYDEDVLHKKGNMMELTGDKPIASTLDRLARVGTFGIVGDLANSFVNQDVNRGFSIDSRVFAVNSALELGRALSTANQQHGATYATVGRQFVAAMGGSGYLQWAQIFNNALSLDNAEARVTSRINVGNWLRTSGRTIGMEVKVTKGGDFTSNQVSPWITEMVLAAYVADYSGFNDAKMRAKQEAREMRQDDPEDYVAKAFQSRHPLKTIFRSPPTEQQYRRLLNAMPDRGKQDVQSAISLFNRFGESLGLNPYEGKVESRSAGRPVSVDIQNLRRATLTESLFGI